MLVMGEELLEGLHVTSWKSTSHQRRHNVTNAKTVLLFLLLLLLLFLLLPSPSSPLRM